MKRVPKPEDLCTLSKLSLQWKSDPQTFDSHFWTNRSEQVFKRLVSNSTHYTDEDHSATVKANSLCVVSRTKQNFAYNLTVIHLASNKLSKSSIEEVIFRFLVNINAMQKWSIQNCTQFWDEFGDCNKVHASWRLEPLFNLFL